MNSKRMPKLDNGFHYEIKFLKFSIFFLITFWLAVTVIVMLIRLRYPYQLEWMEGGEIEHIQRLLDGKKIYCEPSMDFIPYIYTPFFYYIGVVASLIVEPNFVSMRLISILSFLLSLFVVYKIIFDYTQDKFWSFLGVGLYSLSFSTTGFWFDIARVDTTANLFLIISFYFLLKENRLAIVISALFSFLAFYTKQSYLLISMMLILALLVHFPKKALLFSSIYFSLVIATTIIETINSQGWYLFWNFYFPSTHHWIWSRAITFWTIDILPFYSIALALILAFFLIIVKQNIDSRHFILLFLFLGSLLTSYSSRLHYGGYLNVLIPFAFSISISLPIALHYFDKSFNSKIFLKVFLLILTFFQLVLLFYDPTYVIPTNKDKMEVENLLAFSKNIGKDVYLTGYNYVQKKYGLNSYPHYVLVNDLIISKVPQRENFLYQFETFLKEKKFNAIVLDEDLHLPFLEKYYNKTDTIFYHRVLNSKESPQRRERVWLPR